MSGFNKNVAVMQVATFSLSPALSRWEREKRSPRLGKSGADCWAVAREFQENFQRLFPLPAGEGEGERFAGAERP